MQEGWHLWKCNTHQIYCHMLAGFLAILQLLCHFNKSPKRMTLMATLTKNLRVKPRNWFPSPCAVNMVTNFTHICHSNAAQISEKRAKLLRIWCGVLKGITIRGCNPRTVYPAATVRLNKTDSLNYKCWVIRTSPMFPTLLFTLFFFLIWKFFTKIIHTYSWADFPSM